MINDNDVDILLFRAYEHSEDLTTKYEAVLDQINKIIYDDDFAKDQSSDEIYADKFIKIVDIMRECYEQN